MKKMEKTILIILVGVIILAAAGGAYMYLSQLQKPQQQTQSQTQPQQQQQQQTPTENQDQQQHQDTGAQQEQQQQEEQQQEQQEYTFDQFLSNIIGKAFKITGIFSSQSVSGGDSVIMKGNFAMAIKENMYKYYMEITESSEGIKGESVIFSFQNDTNLVTTIMCMKSAQTQNKWMCFKSTMSPGEAEQQMGEQVVVENPTQTWEGYKSRFTYEGLKEINGVMLHCFYANYRENDTNVEERVCFDPQLNFFRYYWSKRVGSDGSFEWELFVDSVTFSVSNEEFVPPATPRSFPGIPSTP